MKGRGICGYGMIVVKQLKAKQDHYLDLTWTET